MAIYSGFSHEKWWFSIVMLVYQGYQRAVENDQCVVGFGYWYAFCCYCWRTRMWRECKKTDILQQYWGSNLNPSGWIEIIHQPDKFGYSSRVFPHPNHHLRSKLEWNRFSWGRYSLSRLFAIKHPIVYPNWWKKSLRSWWWLITLSPWLNQLMCSADITNKRIFLIIHQSEFLAENFPCLKNIEIFQWSPQVQPHPEAQPGHLQRLPQAHLISKQDATSSMQAEDQALLSGKLGGISQWTWQVQRGFHGQFFSNP